MSPGWYGCQCIQPIFSILSVLSGIFLRHEDVYQSLNKISPVANLLHTRTEVSREADLEKRSEPGEDNSKFTRVDNKNARYSFHVNF